MLMLALLLATPTTITLATASRDEGQLEMVVHADGPLAAAQVSARLEEHKLFVLVPGATLDRDERTFHELHRYIQARRTEAGVELVVPLGSHVACELPVTAEARAFGLELRLACRGTVATQRAGETAAASAAATGDPATTTTTTAVATNTTTAAVATTTTTAAVSTNSAAPTITEAHAQAAAPARPAAAAAAAALVARESPQPAALSDSPVSAPRPAQTLPLLDAAPASGSGSPQPRAAGLAALAVCAIAAAALVLRRKRRPASTMQVLETIALGPKRSLILARVGTETLLLAASEAGVSLLSTNATLDGLAAAARRAPARPQKPESDLESEPAFTQQPSRAFNAYAAPTPVRDEPPAPKTSLLGRLKMATQPSPRFDTLFAETEEDQELRGKLARGLSARVS